jgi:N-acetylneuraminate synthase
MAVKEKNPVLVIAEAGVNHNGKMDLAEELVRVSESSGADAVKFQTFRAQNLVTKYADKAEYQKNLTGSSSQLRMLEKLELSYEAHEKLATLCGDLGIQFLSTAFDHESLGFLANVLKMPLFKIPSGEITNGPLLLEYSKTGGDLILSTGMADLDEIREALGVLAFGMTFDDCQPSRDKFLEAYESDIARDILKKKVTLLQCTTDYPTRDEDVNLRAIETMQNEFELPVGLSDHTDGITAAIAAVTLGCVIIEKHITLDRELPGPDHQASIEPEDFARMVAGIRQVSNMLGDGVKKPSNREGMNRPIVRKSIVAKTNIEIGEKLTTENLAIKRPGTGKSPMEYWDSLGRASTKSYFKDDVI